ncbi:GTPase-activating protein S13 [Spiromyces aspiralis]|uniref:GTPase-activating protein S13 n=1 Tax=Spiromyces aspiralis TaxID=68401 RepID=A0ACC1HU87_9FUNG|nr:GTPase-activating protein S13 [Spiromyces aspiralis]
MDYYGKRLATASSDSKIKVFDVDADDIQKSCKELKEHTGAVWQVAWAHPKFGTILASCSYDGRVLIWKETAESGWMVIKEYAEHKGSVNSIAWAPHELGPTLACGSSDGRISLLTFTEEGVWEDQMIEEAHLHGVNAVSWAPAVPVGAITQPTVGTNGPAPLVKQLVSGGCDNLIKIWTWDGETKQFSNTKTLSGHQDWVRDVAFAPNIGLPRMYLASCSQDKTVLIWTQDASAPGEWKQQPLTNNLFGDVVWRVSWSLSGNVLAVSCGDNKITLWKENLQGQWERISEYNEKGPIQPGSEVSAAQITSPEQQQQQQQPAYQQQQQQTPQPQQSQPTYGQQQYYQQQPPQQQFHQPPPPPPPAATSSGYYGGHHH